MVYLITNSSEEICKIGYSSNPKARLATLQTGCPYPLTLSATIVGEYDKEAELHERFCKYRLQGEWFVYSKEIKNYFGIEDYVIINPVALLSVQGAERTLLISITTIIDFNNIFTFTNKERKAISKVCGLSINTINSAIAKLVKSGLVVKLNTIQYQVDRSLYYR